MEAGTGRMAGHGLMYGLKVMLCPLLFSLLVLLLVPPAARLTMPALPMADNRKPFAMVASVFNFSSILMIHFVGLFVLRFRGLAALAWWSVGAVFLVTRSTLASRNGTDYGELLAAGIVSGFMLIITLVTLLFPSLPEKMVGVVVVVPVPSSE